MCLAHVRSCQNRACPTCYKLREMVRQSRARERIRQKRAPFMARWRMVSRVIGTLMLAWRRAIERAYAPGGAGFDACHQEFAALAGRDP